ncbi:hypothetical protein GMLC_04010 [Geomonas limicola]|uniref:Tetratricopeptide repeat protein n=1 Tax=Geomonas limicola TaxID=2740186 RepID=A0A6V8N2S3_9BACT|nr:tetratricopeptide repeat protein [Geomonas limicola]GFO66822.1 hypothetical protein GMLC_04010 [Geomonas limicola]
MVEEAISFWSEIQRFENMLEADPRSLSFAPLSELYRKLGLLDDAILVAKKGCRLHPDYPGGFFALGAAFFDKGIKDEARSALERAAELNPEHVRALKLLSQLYVDEGDLRLAQKVLNQVLVQNPEDAESVLLLQSLESMPDLSPALVSAAPEEDEEEIIEDVEVIEDLEPLEDEPEEFPSAGTGVRDPLTTATLAELYVSQGFLDKAIAIYQELSAAAPANQGYRLRWAELKTALDHQQAGTLPAADVTFDFPASDEELELDEDAPAWEPVAAPKSGLDALFTPDEPASPPATPLSAAPVEAPAFPSAAPAAALFETPVFEVEPEPAVAPVLSDPEPLDASGPDEFTANDAFPAFEDLGILEEPEPVTASPAPGALEAEPATVQPAAVSAAATGGAGEEAELVTELSRWLDNIRRRKDGL